MIIEIDGEKLESGLVRFWDYMYFIPEDLVDEFDLLKSKITRELDWKKKDVLVSEFEEKFDDYTVSENSEEMMNQVYFRKVQ